MNNPKIKVVEVNSLEELQRALKENGLPDMMVTGIGDAIREHAEGEAEKAAPGQVEKVNQSIKEALGRTTKAPHPPVMGEPDRVGGTPKEKPSVDTLHNMYVAFVALFKTMNIEVPAFEYFLKGVVLSSFDTAKGCLKRNDMSGVLDYLNMALNAQKRLVTIAKNKDDLAKEGSKHD